MAGRRLAADEQALWARIAAGVRPLSPGMPVVAVPPAPLPPPAVATVATAPSRPEARIPRGAPGTLDGSWDRALRRGAVAPDLAIDLHGHTLAEAHAALDRTLERALGEQARLLLLITGRPPREGERRGAIRASIDGWLKASRHFGRIAAVRNAHPRHGGAGALYVVLRRDKGAG